MARAEGIEIEEIVLHPFGGLARLKTEPQNPRAEFRIAVAGPAASFLFALLAFVGAKIAALGNYEGTVVVFFLIASATCCSRSSISFPVIRLMADASCAPFFAPQPARSRMQLAKPASAEC